MQIRERDRLLVADVTVPFHPAGRATGHENGQIRVVMDVRIADAAAVENERMVEQRAATLGRGLQSLQEVREERNVKRIDLRHAGDLLWVVSMMGQRVVRI